MAPYHRGDHGRGSGRRHPQADVPKLLDGPLRCGVLSEIPVHDSACANVENHEDVQPLKGGGYYDEGVAGKDDAGVIVEEGRPRLGERPPRFRGRDGM
jgi:hypothetical protein